jgi:chaperonin GroES
VTPDPVNAEPAEPGNAPEATERAETADATGATGSEAEVEPRPRGFASPSLEKLPVKMLTDRILVDLETDGERRSTGGILIPATAQMGKRLAWGEVIAVGPNVRTMEVGDHVLFNPEDRYEVEVRGQDYLILRERDIHAVAAKRLEEGSTGLYL